MCGYWKWSFFSLYFSLLFLIEVPVPVWKRRGFRGVEEEEDEELLGWGDWVAFGVKR